MKPFTYHAGLGAILAVLCGSPAGAVPVFTARGEISGVTYEYNTSDTVAGAQARYPVDAYGNFTWGTWVPRESQRQRSTIS
jgi:hypothetical protein